MFNIYAKTKFAQLSNRWLKVALFTLGSLLFSYSNADSVPTGEPVNESKIENPYFMDFDSLQIRPSPNRHPGDLIYTQKDDPETIWVFLPLRNIMLAHYRTVAAVLAPALQKKLDASAAVPLTKFVVQKQADGQGYKLLGCAYQEHSLVSSFARAVRKIGYANYTTSIFYEDHRVERHVLTWNYLGLPDSPALFVVAGDSRLVRYDYDDAFQYGISENVDENFCVSYLSTNGCCCDPEYIKIFQPELQAQYQIKLRQVIAEIGTSVNQYLDGRDLSEVNNAFEEIIRDYGS